MSVAMEETSSALLNWPLWLDSQMFLFGALSIIVHLWLSKSDLRLLVAKLLETYKQPKHLMTRREADKRIRIEEELLKTRIKCLNLGWSLDFQCCFPLFLASAYGLIVEPLQFSSLPALCPVVSYFSHFFFQVGVLEIQKSDRHFQLFRVFCYLLYATYLIGIATITDVEQFRRMEQLSKIGLILVSILFIDLKLAVPTYASGAAVLIYKHWTLTGGKFDLMFILILISHAFGACLSVFIVHCIHSLVVVKAESDSMDSVLLAFRKVLRGVCDGELVLDSHSYQILEDASSLERLLHAEKLSETNFLDLFLETESRETFMRFLQSESIQKETAAGIPHIPPSLRISLQSARGPVSMDIFGTKFGAAGQEYILLALKADPDQVLVPPDAEDTVTMSWPTTSRVEGMEMLPSPSLASLEVTEAFKELVQVSLMVNDDTPAFDIEEATLSFFRKKRSSNQLSGMPTVRSLVKLHDWQRLEAIFNATQQSQIPHRLAAPLLFRIPGSKPRSYLCAKEVRVSAVEGEPLGTFSVNLSCFDAKHVQKPKEQDLQSISENSCCSESS